MWAFYKDFGDHWMVVIVGPDRSGEPNIGEVVDMKQGTKTECDVFARSYLGGAGEVVYTAPPPIQ